MAAAGRDERRRCWRRRHHGGPTGCCTNSAWRRGWPLPRGGKGQPCCGPRSAQPTDPSYRRRWPDASGILDLNHEHFQQKNLVRRRAVRQLPCSCRGSARTSQRRRADCPLRRSALPGSRVSEPLHALEGGRKGTALSFRCGAEARRLCHNVSARSSIAP
jgi:hypothetical protein